MDRLGIRLWSKRTFDHSQKPRTSTRRREGIREQVKWEKKRGRGPPFSQFLRFQSPSFRPVPLPPLKPWVSEDDMRLAFSVMRWLVPSRLLFLQKTTEDESGLCGIFVRWSSSQEELSTQVEKNQSKICVKCFPECLSVGRLVSFSTSFFTIVGSS